MIIGGAIGGEGWAAYVAIAAVVALVALAALGAAAGLLAGRARGTVLGLVVFATTFWSLAVVGDASAEAAIGAGVVLALLAALVLRVPVEGPDGRSPAWRRRLPSVASVAIVVAVALVGVHGVRSSEQAEAADATRDEADHVTVVLADASPATTSALDLALLVAVPSGGPGVPARADLLSARGDRDDGGATLVLRLADRHGSTVTHGCWRFEVAASAPVSSTSVRCPSAPVDVPSNIGEQLYQPVAALALPQQTDAAPVERATASTIDDLLGADVPAEVDQLDERSVGLAISIDPARCLLVTFRATPGGTSVDTTYAAADALRSDGAGCRASLAR